MLRHLLLRRPRRISSLVPSYRFYSTQPSFVPSPEQVSIIERCRHRNVVVSARPGVGKTATAEALVQANPSLPIAVVTYSKRLQLDTQRRLAGYDHVDTFTFHGLASRLFGGMIHNDGVLRNLRRTQAIPSWNHMPTYAYVVLDELQDLTPDLYWLTNMFISTLTRATGLAPQILALGDAKQAIYEFRDADARFLDLAPSVFSAISPREWDALALSKSFRLSQETASFVNHAFLGGQEYIVGQRSGEPKPIYAHADMADIPKILDLIVPLIKQYGPQNTAILAPYVRANPLLPPLTNALSKQYKIPVAVSTSDDTPLDQDVMNGKVTVSTYHQFKGSERDLVILYGVEAGYFNFMGRDLPDDRCPNTIFVALTRARHQLVLLQAKDWPAMPFVNFNAVKKHAQVLNLTDAKPKRQYDPGRPLRTGLLLPVKIWATEAARHVRDEELHTLVHQHTQIKERAALPSDLSLAAPDKVCTDPARNHHEAVSDLNGLAVTAAFEWRFAQTLTAFGYGKARPPEIPKDEHGRGVWLTRDAARYESEVSQYKSRLAQMADHAFDWLVPFLESATERLQNELKRDGALGEGGKLEFEVPLRRNLSVSEPGTEEKQETELVGRPDIVHVQGRGKNAQVTIWEIKFVGGLSLEHVVQAVVYGYLWAMRHKMAPFPRIVLFNVRDGSRWDITTTVKDARSLIEGVLRAKYTARGQTPVDVFLKDCDGIQKEVEEVVRGFKTGPKGSGVDIGLVAKRKQVQSCPKKTSLRSKPGKSSDIVPPSPTTEPEEAGIEPASALEVKPEQGRGRPKIVATLRKPVKSSPIAHLPTAEQPEIKTRSDIKPPRGRGRPKKVDVGVPVLKLKKRRVSVKTQPAEAARKRGRPRKIHI